MTVQGILSFKAESTGYYFEVEKISENFSVHNYIKKYPCCEVVDLPRKSILKFYKDPDEPSFQYKNIKDTEVQIICFKEELKGNIPTEVEIFINTGEQLSKEEFKEFVNRIRT